MRIKLCGSGAMVADETEFRFLPYNEQSTYVQCVALTDWRAVHKTACVCVCARAVRFVAVRCDHVWFARLCACQAVNPSASVPTCHRSQYPQLDLGENTIDRFLHV